ncbi:MAG: tryptophan--tRNA ligase [Saprospiraceae bacterium]|nr:tryptophan--tRNA ligase [Saprospiraceae bacterium]MCB0543310.1 tryptophan--tRNA ligase [Saprospiraceae bacterium]MCB0575484.1 tryptophan--tRNA ligase [Saprospiraceae bacterium]MCB9354163.1 tryptophan--tRNA ligase [Lewinellaceae bacterium]
MKNIFSGIQPTGDLHLGNYFGAVKNWVQLQDEYECTYCVVDYHSMTMPYKADQLRENIWKMVFYLLACGVKPENLFVQSMVPEHVELSWVLGGVASYGELNRMTQFKDKTKQLLEKDKDGFVSSGLFIYPVLQAADILMYHTDYVPVGKDQEQHLELSRNIAQRFNYQFGKEYFVHPEPLFTETPKILSTADPNKKMGKSLGEKHYINLFGDDERIRKQVRSAVTDTGDTPAGEMSPGIENLFTLLRATGRTDAHDALMAEYKAGTLKYSALKEEVAEALVALVGPFREKLAELNADKRKVKSMIQDSSAEVRKRAQQTMREVRELTGLPNLK